MEKDITRDSEKDSASQAIAPRQMVPEFAHDMGVIIVFASRKDLFGEDPKDTFCRLLTGSPFHSMSPETQCNSPSSSQMRFSLPYHLNEPVEYEEQPETLKEGLRVKPIKRRISCVQLLAMTEFGGANTLSLVSVDIYASLCALLAVLNMRSQPFFGILFLGESAGITGQVGPLIEKLAKHVIGPGRSQFHFASTSWFHPPSPRNARQFEIKEPQIRLWLNKMFVPSHSDSSSATRCRFTRFQDSPQSAVDIVLSFLRNISALSEASSPLLQMQIPGRSELSEMSMGIEYDAKIKRELRELERSIRREMGAGVNLGDVPLAEFLNEAFQLLAPYLELHPYSHLLRWAEWTRLQSAVTDLVAGRTFYLAFGTTDLLGTLINGAGDEHFSLRAAERHHTYYAICPTFVETSDNTLALTHVLQSMALMLFFGLRLNGLIYSLGPDNVGPTASVCKLLSEVCGSTRTKHLVIARPTWPASHIESVRSHLPGARCLVATGLSSGELESALLGYLDRLLPGNGSLTTPGQQLQACEEVVDTPFSDTVCGLEIQAFLTKQLCEQQDEFRSSRHEVAGTDRATLRPLWERQTRIFLLQWSLIRFTGSNHIYEEIMQEIEEDAEIEKNITRLQAIVTLQSDLNPEKGHKLAQLGSLYSAHFDMYGDSQQLEQSLKEYDQAVALVSDDDPKRAEYLSALGAHLEKKFQLFGSKDDLIRGILKCKEAVAWHYQHDSSSSPNLKKAFAQHAVGALLKRKFETYFDNPRDIEEAIQCFHEAKRFTPYGHQAGAIIFADLCHSHVLKSKYHSLKNDVPAAVVDIENAMDQYNRTLPEPGPNHPGYAMILNAKCVAYAKHHKLVRVKGRSSRYTSDIQEAIRAGELAVSHVEGKSQEATYLLSLGKAYWYSYEAISEAAQATGTGTEDLTKAIECLRHAASQCESADKTTRFKAARGWAKLEAAKQKLNPLPQQDLKETLKAYEFCIILLAEIASQEIPIHEQYRRLEKIQRVVYQATAAAVQYGRLEKAVEFFEEGRSVIWRHYLKHDVLMHALKEKHPELAKEYSQFLNQLRSQAADAENSTTYLKQTEDGVPRSQAPSSNFIVAGLKKAWKAITSIADFSSFSLYKKLNVLDTASQYGPIVLINLDQDRCDALVIRRKKSVLHVHLPSMTTLKAKSLQRTLRSLLGESISDTTRGMKTKKISGGRKSEKDNMDPLSTILAELWVAVVKPIVDVLTKASISSKSHVFWCSASHLAFLPLHAAGDYSSKESNAKLSDIYTSSYIPNIFSLIRTPDTSKGSFQLLAVAQSKTPRQIPLPQTIDEVEHIRKHDLAGKYAKVLINEEGTVHQVKLDLVKSQWAHFACHGIQDEVDGLQSALLLDEGKRLTLKDLVKLKIPNAELAFLSACQSAKGDITLPEEHIHLAAGMLVAGYQGVIGTMWSIKDEDGLHVARKVYDKLFARAQKRGSSISSKLFSMGGLIGDDKGRPDFKEAAEVLNEVVAELREGVDPIRWVPFVHIGL